MIPKLTQSKLVSLYLPLVLSFASASMAQVEQVVLEEIRHVEYLENLSSDYAFGPPRFSDTAAFAKVYRSVGAQLRGVGSPLVASFSEVESDVGRREIYSSAEAITDDESALVVYLQNQTSKGQHWFRVSSDSGTEIVSQSFGAVDFDGRWTTDSERVQLDEFIGHANGLFFHGPFPFFGQSDFIAFGDFDPPDGIESDQLSSPLTIPGLQYYGNQNDTDLVRWHSLGDERSLFFHGPTIALIDHSIPHDVRLVDQLSLAEVSVQSGDSGDFSDIEFVYAIEPATTGDFVEGLGPSGYTFYIGTNFGVYFLTVTAPPLTTAPAGAANYGEFELGISRVADHPGHVLEYTDGIVDRLYGGASLTDLLLVGERSFGFSSKVYMYAPFSDSRSDYTPAWDLYAYSGPLALPGYYFGFGRSGRYVHVQTSRGYTSYLLDTIPFESSDPSAIMRQPETQVAEPEGIVSFKAFALGDTYQWFRKPAGGSEFVPLEDSDFIDGVSTDHLYLGGDEVTASNDGDEFLYETMIGGQLVRSEPATLVVEGASDDGTPPAAELDWYSDAASLGDNWYWLEWLGYFNLSEDPWIFHQEHGWWLPFGDNPDSLFFYDVQMQAFLFTSETLYPNMYRFSDEKWIWYQKGSSNPRWFVDLATGIWEQW